MSAVTHTTSLLFCSAILVASAAPQDDEILLVDFKGTKGATHSWRANNDPVMGGQR